jgi:3-deoxy-D-manno-octulosonate 8-phosphate phosphatase (KDO 8-P phosphatase)
MASSFGRIEVVAFDIDGTLTDAKTTWLGPEIGWTQIYSTRDGEAILHLVRSGIVVLPLSRNTTLVARSRMEALKLPLDFLGVSDKATAIPELAKKTERSLERVLFVGDGREDAEVFRQVGLGCAVRDAHPDALAAAHVVLESRGGERVMEEISVRILKAREVER